MSEQNAYDRTVTPGEHVYHDHRPRWNDPAEVWRENRGRWTSEAPHVDYTAKQPRLSREQWRRQKEQSDAIDAAIVRARERKNLLANGVRGVL